jgi:hypothetical protein
MVDQFRVALNQEADHLAFVRRCLTDEINRELVLAEAFLIQGGIPVNVKVIRVEPGRQWARACTRLITMSTK